MLILSKKSVIIIEISLILFATAECARAVLKEKFTMTILDSVKGTVNTAVDTISSVAQTIVEKNRTNAKLNR